ncbi:hypothetical protein SAMN04487996_13626 [Dyadobacter soli]|uniref:Uncharacterized protein n=1 Tax=Dyadobacter soli TaxID=659014 RepID=A0A1G8C7U0_9BACT|nr:hypothetical protein [Dyadobacter soli]SDH41597.1 hypothetical protein SAMN04487996_13626 [Dyadobacter soli]
MNTLEIFEEKGRKKGVEEGKQETTHKSVRNMIKQSSLTNEQIASIMEVSVNYVAEIREDLAAE